jgi:hypothetical protein
MLWDLAWISHLKKVFSIEFLFAISISIGLNTRSVIYF